MKFEIKLLKISLVYNLIYLDVGFSEKAVNKNQNRKLDASNAIHMRLLKSVKGLNLIFSENQYQVFSKLYSRRNSK